MKCKLVAYYRVSTEKQGRSGLGLEGQRVAVKAYVTQTGCDLVGSYTEVETAKKDALDNRTELRKAIGSRETRQGYSCYREARSSQPQRISNCRTAS